MFLGTSLSLCPQLVTCRCTPAHGNVGQTQRCTSSHKALPGWSCKSCPDLFLGYSELGSSCKSTQNFIPGSVDREATGAGGDTQSYCISFEVTEVLKSTWWCLHDTLSILKGTEMYTEKVMNCTICKYLTETCFKTKH